MGSTLLPDLAALLSFSGAVGKAQFVEIREQERKARELVTAGHAEEAVAIYRELVQTSSNNPTLVMNFVVALFKAEHYSEVIDQCKGVLEEHPKLIPALFFLGASYYELGDLDRAVEPLGEVVQARGDDRNSRIMLAEALLVLQRYGDAVEHFRRATQLLPENPRGWFGFGWSCHELSKDATQTLEEIDPDSAYVLALLADDRLKQKQFGSAFYYYRQALERKSGLRGLHASLSTIYTETGHLDWAALERRREAGIPTPDCATDQLECEFRAGRHWEVVQLADASNPVTPAAVYWKAKAYQQLAHEAFARLSAFPETSQLHELRARTLDEQARHRLAAKEWRKALELSPESQHLRKGLALSLYHARDFEKVIPILENLLKEDPTSPDLHYLYGSSFLNVEKPGKAAPLLQAALRQKEDLLQAHADLGFAYLQLDQPEKAIAHLLAALPADEDGTYHYRLARAYQAVGQTERAKKSLNSYQEIRTKAQERRTERERNFSIRPPL